MHTPGPWTPYGLDWRMVVDKDSAVIADIRTNNADARLIAAAPDLLAALEEAHEVLDEGFLGIPEPVQAALDDYYKALDPKSRWASLVDVETYDRQEKTAERVAAAIAKAKGLEP